MDRNLTLKRYGICKKCKSINTDYGSWCKHCDPYRIPEEGSISGNAIIDLFLRQSQSKVRNYEKYLEFIPFEKFENVKKIGEGGFSEIYIAIWKEGIRKMIIKKNKY